MALAVVALVASAAAGCGADTATPGDPTPEPDPVIAGEYVSNGLPAPFDGGDVLRLTLADGAISFQATCNTMSGNATWDDGVLRVDRLGGTEMGCPGAGFEQDEWLVDFFSGEPTVRLDGDDVAIARGADEIWFVPASQGGGQAEPTTTLDGTVWTLTGIEKTDGDSVGFIGVLPGIDSTLLIERARMRVHTGCNRGSAEVSVRDDVLGVGPLALTKMACPGAASEIERGVVAVLQGSEVGWSISGSQLRLRSGDRALIYDAE